MNTTLGTEIFKVCVRVFLLFDYSAVYLNTEYSSVITITCTFVPVALKGSSLEWGRRRLKPIYSLLLFVSILLH